MLASYHGHLPLVQLLLQHGADPNTLNDRGQSPLAGAVFKNEEEIIKALLGGVSFDLFLCRLFPLLTPKG
jgi:ankyrin repeat protein